RAAPRSPPASRTRVPTRPGSPAGGRPRPLSPAPDAAPRGRADRRPSGHSVRIRPALWTQCTLARGCRPCQHEPTDSPEEMMLVSQTAIETRVLGNYIDGDWRPAQAGDQLHVTNP